MSRSVLSLSGSLLALLLVFTLALPVGADDQQAAQKTTASSKAPKDKLTAFKKETPKKKAPKKEATKKEAPKKKETPKKKEDKADKSKLSVTQGKVLIDGKKIAYTATAGPMPLKSDSGDSKANVFYVAYTVKPKKGEKRPVTFCFNGGPGSSSVWLHLGMLGPKRVKLDSDAHPIRPPHTLISNPYSLLDRTDLVFIDPVSTGYSRPAKGENKRQFHGFEEDVQSVAQFIHNYTTKNGRWGSPKFLIGESYGGLRAAGLSGHLQKRYHMYLNGIVLVSSVVDFQTIAMGKGNDIAYSLFLPSYTATAWYHNALSDDLQSLPLKKVVAMAEQFASGPYMRALVAGDSLPEKRRKRVVARMAELTGLSPTYVEGANLRVSMSRFNKELLRSRRRVVGRFDSRYLGIENDSVGETAGTDPSASAVFGSFTSAMNEYLRDDLKVKEERVYEILTHNVHPWNYDRYTNRYVSASDTLRQAMTSNPYLKVLATCGYYDLATPQYAMQYTQDHLGLSPELRKNFTMRFYEGGHMMYSHEPSLRQLRSDLLEFYTSALESELE